MSNGRKIIKDFVETAPDVPGTYRMLGEKGDVLYVGKAKNLKKRISSYTILEKLPPRLQRMVMTTASMEITITRNEAEALLLESNLIKNLKPRFNILLRDDKSFPYIAINKEHDFPRISKHRGDKKTASVYFGPYPSGGDVNRAISALQKAFLIRPCADSIFSNRSRPCLEYQIKRCSAPCVAKISKEEYAILVKQAEEFFSDKSHEVQQQLTEQMEEASRKTNYEKAAIYRDRIRALSAIQAKQGININSIKDADVIALAKDGEKICIQVFFIRGGQTIGNKPYFPSQTEGYKSAEIMEAFLSRFYQDNIPPKLVLLSHDVFGKKLLEEALKIKLFLPQKGEKRALVETALANAKEALERKIHEAAGEKELLKKLADLFGIDDEIKRIEVYDNSHIFGKHAVGTMIVAGPEGFNKSAYRRFNVDAGAKKTGGDDYFMMRQVLTRRFTKMADENRPDLVLIDGGGAHMKVAEQVFADLGISEIFFACIAKGPDRNAGREDFYIPGKKPFKLTEGDPLLYYLQRLRDEAHRFAIMSHRSKRAKSITKSALDEIPGIGAKRKKALLNHFGSVNGIEQATIEELMKVEGINKKAAQQIHDWLRG